MFHLNRSLTLNCWPVLNGHPKPLKMSLVSPTNLAVSNLSPERSPAWTAKTTPAPNQNLNLPSRDVTRCLSKREPLGGKFVNLWNVSNASCRMIVSPVIKKRWPRAYVATCNMRSRPYKQLSINSTKENVNERFQS